MEAILQEFWAPLSAALAVMVWLIRLEASVKATKLDIERLWKQRDEDMKVASDSRSETHELLTELRQDVKQILSTMPKRP